MSYTSRLFASYGAPVVGQYSGQTITGYVEGNRQNSVQLEKVLVDLSFESGTNELPGDGPVPFEPTGERERRSGHLAILRTTVAEHSIKETWSFWIDDELWFIQRRNAKDNEGGAYANYLITSVDPRKSRHSQIEPNRPVQRR